MPDRYETRGVMLHRLRDELNALDPAEYRVIAVFPDPSTARFNERPWEYVQIVLECVPTDPPATSEKLPVPDLVPRLEVFFNGSDRDAHAVHGWLLAYNYTPTGVYQPDRLNALNWLIAHQAITITHSVDPAMYTIHLDRMARLRDEHSIPPAHPWMRREIDPHGHENDVEEVASRMYAAIYPNTPWPSTEPSTKDEWRNAAAAVLRDYLYSMFDWA